MRGEPIGKPAFLVIQLQPKRIGDAEMRGSLMHQLCRAGHGLDRLERIGKGAGIARQFRG
jgi:hypothetical protein